MTPQQIAQAVAEQLYARDPASRALGIEILEVLPGEARLALTVTGDMVNGHGICHGGFIFTLADTAFAYACNSHNENAVAQHCQISYLAPARQGERLTAEAREIHRHGRNGTTDVVVSNAAGEQIALFRGNSRLIGGQCMADLDG